MHYGSRCRALVGSRKTDVDKWPGAVDLDIINPPSISTSRPGGHAECAGRSAGEGTDGIKLGVVP